MLYRQPQLGRRTMMRDLAAGSIAAVSAAAGCATNSETPALAGPTPDTAADSRTHSESPPRTVLLAYFSRPGMNYYYYGDRIDLEVGNTEVLVSLVRDRRPQQSRAESRRPSRDRWHSA